MYLEESEDCTRVNFSYDCRGCSDCLLCYGIENQQYMIGNQKYEESEYKKEQKNYENSDDSYDLERVQSLFKEMKVNNPIKKTIIYNSENVSGNHLSNCFDVEGSSDVTDSKNCKYIDTFSKAEDCYDSFSW